jgi:hypothetical protein
VAVVEGSQPYRVEKRHTESLSEGAGECTASEGTTRATCSTGACGIGKKKVLAAALAKPRNTVAPARANRDVISNLLMLLELWRRGCPPGQRFMASRDVRENVL